MRLQDPDCMRHFPRPLTNTSLPIHLGPVYRFTTISHSFFTNNILSSSLHTYHKEGFFTFDLFGIIKRTN